MKPYELVLVIKAAFSTEEKTSLLKNIEEIIGKDRIKQKDDIGVLASAYLLGDKKDNNHIHIVSYHLELESKQVNDYTKQFSFLKGLIRHFFYALDSHDSYMTYAEVQKKLEKILPEASAS